MSAREKLIKKYKRKLTKIENIKVNYNDLRSYREEQLYNLGIKSLIKSYKEIIKDLELGWEE